jgi:hypothetical protein
LSAIFSIDPQPLAVRIADRHHRASGKPHVAGERSLLTGHATPTTTAFQSRGDLRHGGRRRFRMNAF